MGQIRRGSKWFHLKSGGVYTVQDEATLEATMTPVVVYQSDEDHKLWVRPTAEFLDGRFISWDDPVRKDE